MNAQKCIQGLLLIAMALSSACTSMDHARKHQPDPQDRLAAMLELDQNAYAHGRMCREIWYDNNRVMDCEAIQREIDRLYVEYPQAERVLLANAVMHFEHGRPEAAQWLLDELLARPGSFPQAGILRSQLALREGNLSLARRVLEEQIVLAPGQPLLHEAVASVHYLTGDYTKADQALRRADLLGAPQWRTNYHRGLLLEGQKETVQACDVYRKSLNQNPGYRQPMARLVGLSHQPDCARALRAVRQSDRPMS
ncbi:hypothetical protein [Abyssibacter sp.]|jgi:tetratricopeptide (TPR) repeat protein|uniref:tetratricopeptide repeat protein n=1 Tax=Abyssibacter sp. TaxID=2320200 RepID=UPI0025C2CC81|nr:hypothetical protein [Abyssibacter sp.]MCK5860085.1 hypothetical protein [Abyssibacter sp.]